MQNSSNNNSRKIVLLALILALAGLGFAYTALSGNDDTDRTTINSKDSCGEPEIAPSKVGEADSDSEISSTETVVDVPHSVEKNNTPEKDNNPTEQPDSTNQADYRTTLPAKQLRAEYLGNNAIPEVTPSAEYHGRGGGSGVNFSELTLREARKNHSTWVDGYAHDLILTLRVAMPEVAKNYVGLQINRIEITTLVSKQSFIGEFEEGFSYISTTIYLPLILNDDYHIRFHLTEQSGSAHIFSGLFSTRGSARPWLLLTVFSDGTAYVRLSELGIAETGKHRIHVKDSNGQPLKNVYLRSLYLEAESDDDGVIDIPSHFFEDDDVMYTDQRVLYVWAQGYVPQFLRISEVKKWEDGRVITLEEIILIKLDGLRKELLPDQNESGFYGSYSASESIDLYPFENSLRLEKQVLSLR